MVEDLLDRGAVDEWREEDAVTKAEKRRQAAYKAKLPLSLKQVREALKSASEKTDDARPRSCADGRNSISMACSIDGVGLINLVSRNTSALETFSRKLSRF
jgi:hypothetical protein